MAKHNILGQKGEDAAIEHLLQTGYTILARNWRHDKYEIDIIAQDKEFIVFVEVKTRSSNQWGNPEDAVSHAKIKRIVSAADFYLNEYDIDLPARFDVIAIVACKEQIEITHFEDAFLPPLE